MVKIGFNTLAWTAVVTDDQFPLMDRLKEIGYDGVECFINGPDVKAFRRFGEHARGLGLENTAVFLVHKEENPIDPSPVVRQRALDRLKWGVDQAYEMGSKLLCGPMHSAHSVFSGQPPTDSEYGWSAEVLHAVGEHAQKAGITIGLEAVNRFECYLVNTMAQMKRLVTEVAHTHVRAMFDTHHANIEEKKNGDAIRDISPMLLHVHISENDRGTPGEGHVQWDDNFSTLADIGYDGWLTIEAFSRNDPAFANAINVWREFDQPWDIATQGLAFIKAQCLKHGL